MIFLNGENKMHVYVYSQNEIWILCLVRYGTLFLKINIIYSPTSYTRISFLANVKKAPTAFVIMA